MAPGRQLDSDERSGTGKRVGQTLYVHRDACSGLTARLQGLLSRALARANSTDWNVAKLSNSGVSLLLYEDFDVAAFPALLKATIVEVASNTTKEIDYSRRPNPPILHRKELLLGLDDPRRPAFAALTRAAEDRGLFRDPTRIGTRRPWLQRIEDAGLELQGHVLVDKGTTVVEVARHKTALSRRDLSQPVALMLRWGIVDQTSTVFDYGCGQGDDVAILQANGIEAFGWDPHHAPYGPRRTADAVNLGFVLNVIEEPNERLETLKAAWSFAKRTLTISVMLPSQAPTAAHRPYRDGFLTSRGTFQRYYAHDELRSLVQETVGERCITLAPGIVAVFRDKELEQEVAYRRRSRAAIIAEGFVVPPRPPRAVRVAPSIRERIQAELEGIWRLALAYGRPPEPGELSKEISRALAAVKVSAERAISLACNGTFDPSLLEEAAQARREDLLVHFALSLFPGATRYTTLPRSIQRDVRTFFRSHGAALEHAKRLLFSAGDPVALRSAVETAVQMGLGGMLEPDVFAFSLASLPRLPATLRVLVGCGEVLHDDLNAAHYLQLPLNSAAVIAFSCDDPSRHFPSIKSRVEIDLQGLRAKRRRQPGGVLYLKSRYLPADDPARDTQLALDEKLLAKGVILPDGSGPSWDDLKTALAI
jgi:DNA phosphorothioation-associated putative methyltransferase